MENQETKELLEQIRRLADNKSDLDLLKDTLKNVNRAVEINFQNVAQGHNQLHQMITILIESLIRKGLLTEEYIGQIGDSLAKAAAASQQQQRKPAEGLVTAAGGPVNRE